MGFWSSNTQDTSTPEQRAAWRARAKQQIAEQKQQQQEQERDSEPTRHRGARHPRT
jgi:hypothetical protein